MTPLITEDQARFIIEARRDQIREGEVQKWPEFIAEMRRDGTLTRAVSVPTIRKIVEGKYYPRLTDLEGNPYRWERLPTAGRSGGKPNPARELALLKTRVSQLGATVDDLSLRLAHLEAQAK